MTVLDDLKTALEKYATTKCKTEISDYEIEGGVVTLDTNETFKFKVKVTNNGLLLMKNVKVKAIGTTYAKVAFGTGSFGDFAVTDATFDLAPGDEPHKTDYFRGDPKKSTGGVEKPIVTAQIDSWDASLDHILTSCSIAGDPEGKLIKKIVPD